MESKDNSTSDQAIIKTAEIIPLTFDEVAAVIQSGDSDKLREVIDEGRVSDINMQQNKHSPSLLMVACRGGSIECARVLLDHNANINFTSLANNNYQTVYDSVLRSACLSGNVNMLNLLIEHNVTIDDSLILDLFESDEILRNTAIATVLVTKIRDVTFRRIDSHDFLYYAACKAGNATITRMLVERRASFILGRLFSPQLWGLIPILDHLSDAASAGHLEVVELLLQWNVGSERDCQKRANSALCAAAGSGSIDVVQRLVEYGADALTDALYAAVERHVEVAAFLMDKGADFNEVLPSLGRSAWIQACNGCSPAVVRMLLDRGADPNAVDDNGWSPLRAALSYPEAFQMLLDSGADPNRILSTGSTALLRAVLDQRSQSLTVLLEHGADPNLAHAVTGETPLMVAALKLRIDNVRLLLERGADVTQVNSEGRSVLDILGHEKYRAVIELCTGYIECNKPGVAPVLK